MNGIHLRIVAVILSLGVVSSADAQVQTRLAPLLEGMGDHHHPVTTDDPLAQRYFDQGLVLSYAFNHAEAERSFRQAAEIDPECAMCYWGAALVLGPNINAAMDAAAVGPAYEAIQTALRLSDTVTPRERDYIRALAERYAPEPMADRRPLDEAYAAAMRELAKRYPDDPDALTLAAEAQMDLYPWNFWTKEGEAQPWTPEILATLEAVLERFPYHPGANHLYIHAVEASPTPERAEAAADRLRDLVPGAGHLVHMPGHIYIRVGRYHDTSVVNQKAIEADERYVTQCHAQGLYPIGYMPHNHHFLWASATMEGRSKVALDAARHMAMHQDPALMREPGYGTLQHYWITPLYALVRFGRWDEVLAEPKPAEDLVYPTGVWHYARGMAFVRKGRLADAERELRQVSLIAQDSSLEAVTIWDINTTADLMQIAREVLAGELAAARGDYDSAVRHLQTAVDYEYALNYDEPPAFYAPVRQALGAVLLKAGRAAEAEAVYREDLRRNPKNGWSLYGLMQSLREQGEAEEARHVEQQFEQAWSYADVELTASWL